MEKTRIAVIGGTGFEKSFKCARRLRLRTPYGTVHSLYVGSLDGRKMVFLPRHDSAHSIPPHRINYKANIYALHRMGVERILTTNAVGAINCNFKPGETVVPHDFVDFTKQRPATFHDKAPVTHVDVSQPYCPRIRRLLISKAREHNLHVWDEAVLVCTEGPRYETPAEIEAFRRLGCDIVGMTGFPEVVLSRELEMCYASICLVSNMAAGLQKRLTATELSQVSKQVQPKLEQVLIEAIRSLPPEREDSCPCVNALRNARLN